MTGLHVVGSPALQNIVLRLRDAATPPYEFCRLMEEAGLLLAYEAAGSLPRGEDAVETPLGEARAVRVRDEDVVIVAVLRAALPLAMGARRLYRRSPVGFVAARRLEDRRLAGGLFEVELGYAKLPPLEEKHVLLADPMLATGSTASRVLRLLAERGARAATMISVVAAPEGVERALSTAEEAGLPLDLYVASVDPGLDSRGFIVPGLGDAGDRCFGG